MEWGCDTDAVIPLHWEGENLLRCPRRPYKDDPDWYNAIFLAYKYAQKGYLQEPGTWLDQPAILQQAFEVVEGAVNEAKEQEEKRRNRAQSSSSQGGGGKTPPRGAMGGAMSPLPGRG